MERRGFLKMLGLAPAAAVLLDRAAHAFIGDSTDAGLTPIAPSIEPQRTAVYAPAVREDYRAYIGMRNRFFKTRMGLADGANMAPPSRAKVMAARAEIAANEHIQRSLADERVRDSYGIVSHRSVADAMAGSDDWFKGRG